MTYCVAMRLAEGLVFVADSRTNAGVDNISTFRKLFTFGNGKDHALVLLSAGNLATTQSIVELLKRRIDEAEENLMTLPSMYDEAAYIGRLMREIIDRDTHKQQGQGVDLGCSLLLGGQIRGEDPRLFLIYPQGNFIEASKETPFFQIGEFKYGKPILDRIIDFDTPLETAMTCGLISMDSTIKSNLTVDLPLDVLIYNKDSYSLERTKQLGAENEEFLALRKAWGEGIKELFNQLPRTKL